MSKEIRLNSLELMLAASGAQTAADGINVEIKQWEKQGEDSPALDAFAKQFYELEKTMVLYQKLVNQDVEAVRKVTLEFFLSEFNLARLWGNK